MEPWLRAMITADEAEARGDAMGTLEVMEAFATGPDGKYFWRPWRAKYLMQIALFGPNLPGWVTSRWLCNQALQCLHRDNEGRRDRALELAIELRGGRAGLPGRDEADALGRVVDRDWVYRQLFLYELGGLEFFCRQVASSALIAKADSVQEWARASLSAFQLLSSTPESVTWLDMATGEDLVAPNIGSAVLVEPGEHAIGRPVPIEGGQMFEMHPMCVPEQLARTVADDPTAWLETLSKSRRADRSWQDNFQPSYEPSLLSDVPSSVWQMALLPNVEPPAEQDEQDAILARAVLDAATRRLAEGALERRRDEMDVWPCVGAALLDPSVIVGLAFASRPSDVPVLMRLGGLLAEPAASFCRDLAVEIAAAA